MRHTPSELSSKMITMADLEKGLRELNPDIRFDRTDLNIYSGTGEQRTGIYFLERHICNVEVSEIPEYNVPGGIKEVPHMVPVLEGQANTDSEKCSTIQWLVGKGHQLHHEFVLLTNAKFPEVVDLGDGYEIYVTLLDNGDIMCRQYYIDKPIANTIEVTGWRNVFNELCREPIPGIDPQSLSETFDVTYCAGMSADIPMAWMALV